MLIPYRYRLVAAFVWTTVCLLLAGLLLPGCAIGRSIGSPDADMLGIRVGDEASVDAAKTLGGTIGGLLFGPPGAAAGVGIAGAIAGLWRGQRQGWDEHARERTANPNTVVLAPHASGGAVLPSPSGAVPAVPQPAAAT